MKYEFLSTKLREDPVVYYLSWSDNLLERLVMLMD
jgi:hypothetical protein